MSRQASAIRSSHSSRYSPYSRAPISASAHRLPSSSDHHHFSASSGHHAASHPLEADSSLAVPAYHDLPVRGVFPSSPAGSVTLYPSVPAFLSPPPLSAMQPFISTYPLARSTHQDYNFAEQPTHPAQLPLHPNPSLLPPPTINFLYSQQPPHPAPFASPPGPYPPPHPATYLDPSIAHRIQSLPNSRNRSAAPSSITIHEPKYSTDQAHQQPLQSYQGQISSTYPQPGPLNLAHYQSQGMFSGAHNLSFTDTTFIDYNTLSDSFMQNLLQSTIIGAEFDSSDRYPPPRCHPGTRLEIIGRCKTFIAECTGEEKMRWVVGSAGVGKSAIMQMVAEEIPADASVFFSVNGRREGTKLFNTIAYQLAAKYGPYRQFIRNEITQNPALVRKALPVQFQKFIVEPFIHRQHLFSPSDRFLVIIDGLDECDNPAIQLELLRLISGFCVSYPTSPVVWFVASRPEPHIASLFDEPRVVPAYTKEEIMIDSNEACEDVQRFLRDELNKIKHAYPTLKRKREWPSELEFTKIATAAGGLFAYASTVVRYIGDPHHGDPVSQLSDVLVVIDVGLKDGIVNNPLALLDALYERIISKISDGVMVNTRKLLLAHLDDFHWSHSNFRFQCNILGLTEDAAYGAVRHLYAVMKVPAPKEANKECLGYFHKSFKDFLLDFKRSRFSCNIQGEVEALMAPCLLRIIQQVPNNFNGAAFGEVIECATYGRLEGNPGFYDNISLSWPGDEDYPATDRHLRFNLYRNSMIRVCHEFRRRSTTFWNMPSLHALTTRFTVLSADFPVVHLRDSLFDKFRPELIDCGKLKQVPLRTLDYAEICGLIEIRFMSVVGTGGKCSDPWNPCCMHAKFEEEDVDGLQSSRDWSTSFARLRSSQKDAHAAADILQFNYNAGKHYHWKYLNNVGPRCLYCSQCLARHFINNPDQLAWVFVDSTELSYVEISFVDPDDEMSKWRYRFVHSGSPSCTD